MKRETKNDTRQVYAEMRSILLGEITDRASKYLEFIRFANGQLGRKDVARNTYLCLASIRTLVRVLANNAVWLDDPTEDIRHMLTDIHFCCTAIQEVIKDYKSE